jgi:hypothetical protein
MGARVTIGDVVGHLVEVADHCPTAGVTCLHWGLRRGSAYLDPLALLRRAPLRLLPLTPPARVSPPMPGPAGPRERATLPGPSPAAVAGTAAAASALPLASAHPRPGPPPGSRPGPTSPRAPSSLLLAPLAGAGAAAVILALPRRRAHPAPGAGDG